MAYSLQLTAYSFGFRAVGCELLAVSSHLAGKAYRSAVPGVAEGECPVPRRSPSLPSLKHTDEQGRTPTDKDEG